jgi:hypothetical protein
MIAEWLAGEEREGLEGRLMELLVMAARLVRSLVWPASIRMP